MKKNLLASLRQIVAAICVAALLGANANPLYATPWTVLGSRAMGMGGAYTAIAEGPVGAYWNPAGLGQPENPSGVQVPVSAHGAFVGSALQGANDVNQVFQNNNTCLTNPASPGCAAKLPSIQGQLLTGLNEMNQAGSGAVVDGGAGMEFKMSRLAFFVNELGVAGATPQVDLTNTSVTPGPRFIGNNNSNLIINGIAMTEFGVGYGHTLGDNTGLNVGANLKGIVGKVGFDQFSVLQNNSGTGNALKDLSNNQATSVHPGVDVGLLWDVREAFPDVWWRPRLGIVGRNINNPKFNQPDAAKESTALAATANATQFSVQGQGRAGIAINPLHFWTLAADVDITNNLTPLQGYKSREVALGTEVNIFNRSWLNIPLRAGISKNVSSNDGLAFGGGFGLNFLHVALDVGGSVSSSKTTIQTENENRSVPTNVGVSAQFSVLFGGRDYKEQHEAKPVASPAAPAPSAVKPATAVPSAKPAATPH